MSHVADWRRLTVDSLLIRMQQQMAQQVLTQFQEHPDAWTRVPDILERSAFPQAKVRATF